MLRSDARILSATNCSLRERIRDGRFRDDLYHRLDGLVLVVPSLRERPEDLPSLIAAELKSAAEEAGKRITSIHPAAMNMLTSYEWPGNLRELHHTMRSTVLFCDGAVVLHEHVEFQRDLAGAVDRNDAVVPTDLSLDAAVTAHILHVFDRVGRNQRRAAKILGISRGKLARHLAAAVPK